MKKILSAFAVALVLAGCAKQYDDTALKNRITTLETKVGNLEAQMKAANAVALGQYVQKVEKTDEGVTVTYGDGTVVTLKISAGSGAGTLSVMKNAAGELCWAIDGEILKYEEKDLLVSQITGISVENGHLFAVIAGTKTDLGAFSSGTGLKDGIFKDIEVTNENVVLTLSDNSTVNIPIGTAFKLVIPKTTYAVTTTDPFDVNYTVQAKIEGTEVDIFTDANFKATVEADKFVITPKAVAEGTALAYADSKVGLTSIVKLKFGGEEEQDYASVVDEKADPANNIDYIGEGTSGSVDAHIVSNVSLDKNSIKPQVSWITVADVKANNYTITLALEDNTTDEIRTGEVFIYEAGTENKLQTLVIAQKAKEVEYEYYNPTGWNKVFNMADYNTNSTFKFNEALTLNPSSVTFQWKFYSNKWNNHKFNDRDDKGNQLFCNRLGEFSNQNESQTVLLRFSNDGDADGQLCLNADFLGIPQTQIRKDNKPYVWPTNEWVVLSIVSDGTSVKVYSNETLLTTIESNNPVASWSFARFDLSMTFDDGSKWPLKQAFNGYSAYTRVWSRALSQEEIAAGLCDVASDAEGLEIYWKFDGADDKAVLNSAAKNSTMELDFTNCWDGNNNAKDNSTAAAGAWTALADSDINGICSKVKGEGGDQPGGNTGGETEQKVKAMYWGNKEASAWFKDFPAAIDLSNGYTVTIHFLYEAAEKQRLCNFGSKDEAPCNMFRFGEKNDPNQLEWMVDAPTSSQRIKLYAGGFKAGEWNAVTVSYATDGTAKIYGNGTLAETKAGSFPTGAQFQGFEFANSWGDAYRSAFKGAYAYVSVWDKVLSDEEVAANVFTVPSGEGLKAFWKMTEGEGYTFAESAGVLEGNYEIDVRYMTRCNDESSYVDFDASNYVEWKEYPAIKAPVAN